MEHQSDLEPQEAKFDQYLSVRTGEGSSLTTCMSGLSMFSFALTSAGPRKLQQEERTNKGHLQAYFV